MLQSTVATAEACGKSARRYSARRADLDVHKVGAVRDVHGLHQLGVANTIDRAQGQVMLPRELTAQRQQSLAQPCASSCPPWRGSSTSSPVERVRT